MQLHSSSIAERSSGIPQTLRSIDLTWIFKLNNVIFYLCCCYYYLSLLLLLLLILMLVLLPTVGCFLAGVLSCRVACVRCSEAEIYIGYRKKGKRKAERWSGGVKPVSAYGSVTPYPGLGQSTWRHTSGKLHFSLYAGLNRMGSSDLLELASLIHSIRLLKPRQHAAQWSKDRGKQSKGGLFHVYLPGWRILII